MRKLSLGISAFSFCLALPSGLNAASPIVEPSVVFGRSEWAGLGARGSVPLADASLAVDFPALGPSVPVPGPRITASVRSGDRGAKLVAEITATLAAWDSSGALVEAIARDKENTPFDLWHGAWRGFARDLKSYRPPLGHGTSSKYLGSILKKGLGAVKPRGASSPAMNNLADLRVKDGLMLAYAAAMRGRRVKGLAVDATAVTGRDLADRYLELILPPGTDPEDVETARKNLARGVDAYERARGPMSGFPLVLVYDGENKVRFTYSNPGAPSEIDSSVIIKGRKLRYVLAPAAKLSQVRRTLLNHGLIAKVLPLELYELKELSENRRTLGKRRAQR